jgi:hypothetical protein
MLQRLLGVLLMLAVAVPAAGQQVVTGSAFYGGYSTNHFAAIGVLRDVHCDFYSQPAPINDEHWRCYADVEVDLPQPLTWRAELEGECIGNAGALAPNIPRLVRAWVYLSAPAPNFTYSYTKSAIRCVHMHDLGASPLP